MDTTQIPALQKEIDPAGARFLVYGTYFGSEVVSINISDTKKGSTTVLSERLVASLLA